MTDADNPAPAVADFPLPENGWARLADRLLVRIAGPGADKFLQGQFSQHLEDVVEGYSPRAAAATPKGRAYCLTRMVREDGGVLLILEAGLAETTLSHLRKYLMLFRNTTAEPLQHGSVFGLLGTSAAEALAGPDLANLHQPGDTFPVAGGFLILTEPTAEGLARYEFWHTGTGEPALDPAFRISSENWRASEIAAGIATLSDANRESFVPQMLNWQHVGGVHFKKGCYTGQEVIARMHFLGQLKKSLFRFRCASDGSTPEPGSRVYSGEKAVGEVVNSVLYRNDSCELLAVVRHDASADSLALEGAPDRILTPCPLPYAVPERENNPPADT